MTGVQGIRPSSLPGHDPRPHRAISVTACGAIALVSAVRPIVGPEVDVEVATDAVVPLLALIVVAVLLLPDLRAAVAAHPNTRQGLLDWLAAQGDPEVTQAIVARHEG